MTEFKVKLFKRGLEIAGESVKGIFCTGKCDIYRVKSVNGIWEVDIAHTRWEDGNEEIVAKNVSSDNLILIRNRLRMGIVKCEAPNFPKTYMCTLRVASIKEEGTSKWANLRNISMGELSELTKTNPIKYFKKLGAITLDYKVDLFNQKGSSSKQLVLIYPKENIKVAIHAYIITRIFPFYSDRSE